MSDQITEAQFNASVNSHQAKTGSGAGQSDSAQDSGVNENVTRDFPGSTVQVGGTKRGDNPAIPDEEGGELNKALGRQTRAEDFEGRGGPEEKIEDAARDRPGEQA